MTVKRSKANTAGALRLSKASEDRRVEARGTLIQKPVMAQVSLIYTINPNLGTHRFAKDLSIHIGETQRDVTLTVIAEGSSENAEVAKLLTELQYSRPGQTLDGDASIASLEGYMVNAAIGQFSQAVPEATILYYVCNFMDEQQPILVV